MKYRTLIFIGRPIASTFFFLILFGSWNFLIADNHSIFPENEGFFFPAPSNLPCTAGVTEIAGTVFEDLNYNGIYDTGEPLGLENVTVTATDSLGNVFSDITDSGGAYSITGLTANRTYRVEFINIPSWTNPTFYECDNGTTVQFHQPGNCANLGLTAPRSYCDTSNPPIIVSCYESGNAFYGATGNENKGIISMPYQSSGGTPTGISEVAKIHEVGTVWGMAWQPSNRHMFTASFLKRHSGFGPEGIGGIYVFEFPSGSDGQVLTSFSLQGVTPANGGAAIDLGTVDRSSGSDYTLPNSNTIDNIDLDAFDKVGKIGYGDLDMMQNDSIMWLVNLNQKALISVDVSNPNSYPGTVNQYLIDDFTNLPTCTNGELRPWGLGFTEDRGYLGCMCTAENSGSASEMHAYVLSFDPLNPTSFTQEVDFPMDYVRENITEFPSFGLSVDGEWNPWVSTWGQTGLGNIPPVEIGFPQPILSDLDFADDGSMIIGFVDRFWISNGI